MVHRHMPGEPCNAACRESAGGSVERPLVTTITDLGQAVVSLGNHLGRTPVAHVADWAERLEFASRECSRLAGELRNAADEARDFARRIA